MEWPSLAANAVGDVGGAVMWGGGAFEENCGAVIHDFRIGYRTLGQLNVEKSNAVPIPAY